MEGWSLRCLMVPVQKSLRPEEWGTQAQAGCPLWEPLLPASRQLQPQGGLFLLRERQLELPGRLVRVVLIPRRASGLAHSCWEVESLGGPGSPV